ncbi:hypothetical protein [Nocardia bovistercoris]|uniref:Uncharacterized protein n=1 Tax=Nocardia bovistercoris TaxID=2785916 RepID=A0A931N640_9NOCA|nr:hypothetical protein [Nocardia bovistercoris]MBH0780367.1 hypothetical protein [Nocardia bovistercoris]
MFKREKSVAQLSLFGAEDVQPCHWHQICGQFVLAAGHPACADCRREFGPLLQPLAAPTIPADPDPDIETPAAVEAGSDQTLARLRALLPGTTAPPTETPAEQRRNQRCWLCEERRTCTQIGGRWECRECQLVE